MDLGKIVGMMAAAVGYTLSVTLMLVASVIDSNHIQRALVGWSLLTFGAAMVLTGMVLLERSRAKVMDYLAHQDLRMAAAVSAAMRGNGDRPTPIR